MEKNVQLIVFPVKDLEKAKKFYELYLGAQPYADTPYYVGYKVGDIEVGLDPNGTAVIVYTDVNDIATSLQALQTVGAEVTKPSTNVGGGLLIAQVTLDGNVMGLRQKPKQ